MVESPSSQAVPRRADGILECELPGELLLHLPGGSTAIALNASARAIWALCDGHRSLETIARDLVQQFDATAGEIPASVRDVVLELVRLQLLVLPAAPDARGAGA